MNLCTVCGADILSANPFVRICGRPSCKEARAAELAREEMRQFSKIPDCGRSSFIAEILRYEGTVNLDNR